MKDYVKIKEDKTLMNMPEMYTAHWDIRNDEITQDFCANHDHWLIREDTAPPEYNPETQYLTFYYKEDNGRAVQVWEVHNIEVDNDE